MSKAITAAEVLTMLAGHYNPPMRRPGWELAAEIAAPNSDRRADLIAYGLTHTAGNALVGHEIKVSRADVLAELKDPTKHDDWARYCTQWWLVVADPELVSGLEIPDHWGIMSPPSGRRTRSMTVVRRAPQLSPVEQSEAWRKIARWQTRRAVVQEEAHTDELRDLRQALATARSQVATLRDSAASSRWSDDLEWAVRLRGRLKERVPGWVRVEDEVVLDLIADAVIDHHATRASAYQIRHELTGLVSRLQNSIAVAVDTAAQIGDAAGAVNDHARLA